MEDLTFHWDDPDDTDGNWQHVFEGHDVEREEVEAFIQRYWNMPGACVERPDRSFAVAGATSTGRGLFAAFRMLDRATRRVWVITCYPVG